MNAVATHGRARWRQSTALARRSILASARQPQNVVPAIVFPLVFAALNTAALGRTTSLPGFPAVDSFLDFVMATTIVQGVLFGAVSAGNDMAIDIETGFLDRLVAAPISRPSILIGRVTGAAVLGLVQALLFLTVLTVFGARVKAGVGGWLVITMAATLLAAAIGSFAMTLAIRTGSAEAVQGFFPLFFAALFFSSAFFPRNLTHGWFRQLATWNPLSWLIEALRHLVIVGNDLGEAAKAIGVAAGLAVVGVTTAWLALHRKIHA